MVAPREDSIDAAIVWAISELENIVLWKKEQRMVMKAFVIGEDIFALLLIGVIKPWPDLTEEGWREKSHSFRNLRGISSCSSSPETSGLTNEKKNYVQHLASEEIFGSHARRAAEGSHTGCNIRTKTVLEDLKTHLGMCFYHNTSKSDQSEKIPCAG